MDFPVSYPGFEGQKLIVKSAGIFDWGSKLLYNGSSPKRVKGSYVVKNNSGSEVLIKLKNDFLDPVPKVIIGQDVIQLARPLKWYEYVWVGFPIILVLQGGAIGGFAGGLAAYTSSRIFRSNRGIVAKYALTGLISVVAVIAYLILATIVQQALFVEHS